MDFTPRNVAKDVVTAIVSMKASELTRNAIADYTQYEKDSMPVKLVGHIVGWGVSDKLKPITNNAVDKTADFIVAKRAERKAKKAAPEQ